MTPMKVLVLGAGMMGRAVAYDLNRSPCFDEILIGDNDSQTIRSVKYFLKDTAIKVIPLDANRTQDVKKHLRTVDVAVSALPYRFNYELAKIAIETNTHWVDLGGNNTIVQCQRRLFSQAKK